ncbi:MAG: carbohydrate ABC transporter permease [Geminicoccaceae bacterium]
MSATAAAIPEDAADWQSVVDRARVRRRWTTTLLYAFLILASLPIVIPYFWLFTVAFSAHGGTDTYVLWRTMAILLPALFAWWILRASIESERQLRRAQWLLGLATLALLGVLTGPYLHLDNWRFLWNRDFSAGVSYAPAAIGGAQFPSVWVAFRNSLLLALGETAIIVTVATLAAYYLSRFNFRGRENVLRYVLVLHAFPAMTLIIPIFLLMYWVGLLDTIVGVMLVICTLELPFAIFIMKGFFDAVPWDIEMSAMTDGASRRQAFVQVLLPQVRFGMLAIGIFAFLRGWEEYVFVRTLLVSKSNWVMSLYLFFVSEDVMGVDYGIVSAVGVFYIVPSLLLYSFTQQYLTQMSVGGIKG